MAKETGRTVAVETVTVETGAGVTAVEAAGRAVEAEVTTGVGVVERGGADVDATIVAEWGVERGELGALPAEAGVASGGGAREERETGPRLGTGFRAIPGDGVGVCAGEAKGRVAAAAASANAFRRCATTER